jgi:hypothetical protein
MRVVPRVPFHLAALAGFLSASLAAQAAPPKSPSILEVRVTPTSLTLDGARDGRKVIVSGRTADGFWRDLTDSARFEATSVVKRDSEGFLRPMKAGRGMMKVTAGGRTVELPVVVKSMADRPVSFVRDVMPLLSRSGCNAGTCHGSVKGKNGFKLSLRGYDPAYDYHALVEDISGRRVSRAVPEQSLMLQKATQDVAHQGGLIFEKDTREYRLLKQWVVQGAKNDMGKVKRASRIEVLPAQPKMSLPGENQQLIVLARYPDGSTRDVTREAVFTSTMPETATVTQDGLVTAARRGEVSVLVRYEGNYAANGVTVLGDRTGYQWAGQPQLNYIDRLVDEKLKRIKAVPSGLCTDAEFIRRVYLDVTGVPPGPEAVRAFLNDPTPSRQKRMKVVDALLASPDYVENWTNKWADMLSVNRKFLGERGAWKFRGWIREQVAANRPYNAFVAEIITASGAAYEQPAASYWRVARDPDQATENVTQLFLGIRFSCNKCHDHPFEKWTQDQYYEFAANFGRIGRRPGSAEGDEAIFERREGEVTHPRLNRVMTASYPYKVEAEALRANTRREALSAWLTSAKNPYFAKSYVNRVWSYFLGKGIIDPVDDIRSSNPPVNPELLDALTDDFVRGGFDVKRLIRTICASRTYQASIKTNRWNADDATNFSHALPRRLAAEQLVDAISRATGSTQRYPGVPAGYRAVQLVDTSVAGGSLLDLFGRPARESPCECERTSTVSLGQMLNLINGPINDSINDPKGRIPALLKTDPTDRAVLEELFLSALCRMPAEAEAKRLLPQLQVKPETLAKARDAAKAKNQTVSDDELRRSLRTQAAQDILWALINSPAFLFNR